MSAKRSEALIKRKYQIVVNCWGTRLVDGQNTTGNIIDVFIEKGDSVLHRQVEMREGRVFVRLKKLPLVSQKDYFADE